MAASNLWIWQDYDERYLPDVIEYVKKETANDKSLVVLHASHNISSIGQSLVEYALKLCQDLLLFENKRTTFLSYKDHLLALEMCISQVKRKKCGKEAEVTAKEILDCHTEYGTNNSLEDTEGLKKEYLLSYKEFLGHTNCTNIWHLGNILQKEKDNSESKIHSFLQNVVFLVLGNLESDASLQLCKVLTEGDSICKVFVESPLNASLECSPGANASNDVTINVNMEMMSLRDITITPAVNSVAATREYAEDTMLAFLCLLVNSRNELALSRAMTCPLINLSHSAFTDLKHASSEKDMPMCQTVISYVTKLRLGNKGYAPSSDCPLHRHLKGLETFVDFINRLQIVIEEEPVAELAVKRAINIIKKRLLKCEKDFRTSSIEEAAQLLTETCLKILNDSCLLPNEERAGMQWGQRTFDSLCALVNYRGSRYHCSDVEVILSEKPSQRTPLNLPPLLGYFRTPQEEESSTHENSRCSVKEAEKIDALKDTGSRSYFHSSDSNSVQKSCINENTPNKTTFKDCLKENVVKKIPRIPRAETTEFFNFDNNKTGKKRAETREGKSSNFDNHKTGTKRSILSDIKNESKSKKVNRSVTTTKKKGPVKTKAQIKGQGNITSFFCK